MREIFRNKQILAAIIFLFVLVAYAYFQGVAVSAQQLSQQYPNKLDMQTAADIDSAIAKEGHADIIVEFWSQATISQALEKVRVEQFQISGTAGAFIRGNSTTSALRTFLGEDSVKLIYYNYQLGTGPLQ